MPEPITITISALLSAAISVISACLGKLWINKKLASQKAENEAKIRNLQAELDKGTHVHRVQFEKEFQIYQEIWSYLVSLEQSALTLMPLKRETHNRELELDGKKKKLNDFKTCYKNFSAAYKNNQPFYEEEIYNILKKADKNIIGSITFCTINIDKDLLDETKKYRKNLLKNISKCCSLIRKRINSLQPSD